MHNRPICCSSFTLERERHIKADEIYEKKYNYYQRPAQHYRNAHTNSSPHRSIVVVFLIAGFTACVFRSLDPAYDGHY